MGKVREHDGIRYEVARGGCSLIPGLSNKYVLLDPYEIQTPITGHLAYTDHIALFETGLLKIAEGYSWDGPSGPTIDTENFQRGSLVHDALYELIREEKVPYYVKSSADMLLRRICRCDGMSRFRSTYVYRAVRDGADWAAMPQRRL